MRRILAICAGAALAGGCTTVTLARLDHCTVQRTTSWSGATREQIVFCDRDAPQWSKDRALRLTQECLYEADLQRRDELILSAREGHKGSPKLDGNTFAECSPEALRSIQAENDALKDRLKRDHEMDAQLDQQRNAFETRLDQQRQHLEAEIDGQRTKLSDQRARLEDRLENHHETLETALLKQHGQLDAMLAGQDGKLADTLSKALDRPVNAVAEAHATSGSDTAVKHNSDSKELTHFDYGASFPPIQRVDQSRATPRVHHRAKAPPKASCGKTCPTPLQAEMHKPESSEASSVPMSR